jgi:hypothetical protein
VVSWPGRTVVLTRTGGMTGPGRPSSSVLSTSWPAEPSTSMPYPPPALTAPNAPGPTPEKGVITNGRLARRSA